MKEFLRIWVLFWPDLQRYCAKTDKTLSDDQLCLESAACPQGRGAVSCLSIALENPSEQSHKQWSETTVGRDDGLGKSLEVNGRFGIAFN